MPSIVGQYYMSWGLGGVIGIGIILGLVVGAIDKLWARNENDECLVVLLATTLAWIFVSFRGLFPGFHYPVLLTLIIYLVSKKRAASLNL